MQQVFGWMVNTNNYFYKFPEVSVEYVNAVNEEQFRGEIAPKVDLTKNTD